MAQPLFVFLKILVDSSYSSSLGWQWGSPVIFSNKGKRVGFPFWEVWFFKLCFCMLVPGGSSLGLCFSRSWPELLGAQGEQQWAWRSDTRFGTSWATWSCVTLGECLPAQASLGSASGKEPACQCKRQGTRVRSLGKIPWRGAWQFTPVFLPGESSWTEEPGGLQSWGRKELDRLSA